MKKAKRTNPTTKVTPKGITSIENFLSPKSSNPKKKPLLKKGDKNGRR